MRTISTLAPPLSSWTPRRQVPSDDHRFFSRVHMTDGCWVWRGRRNARGYGQFVLPRHGRSHTRYAYAHRVIYERVVGPIPSGLVLDHLCRNRACVRPDHLEMVTIWTNTQRSVGNPVVEQAKKIRIRLFEEGSLLGRAIAALHSAGLTPPEISGLLRVSRRHVEEFLGGRRRP